ncbi:MAG: surface lipoprotein assembly modifier [Burkholderiaceae bacterium]
MTDRRTRACLTRVRQRGARVMLFAGFALLMLAPAARAGSLLAQQGLGGPMLWGRNAQVSEAGSAQTDKPYVSRLGRLLSEARSLIDAGGHEAAFERLSESVQLYAGDTEFDYLYAISAIEAGHPDLALLALERVLIHDPGHLLARAEMARALLLVREQENARREFELLTEQEIPAEARAVIARTLDTLSRAPNQPGHVRRAWLQLEIGHDDNVNVASNAESWPLADGTRVIPLASSQPRESAAIGFGGGVELIVPINGRVQWLTGLKAMVHSYPSAHTLDQEQVDLSTGFAYRHQCHQFKMLGQLQILNVDSDPFRRATGVVGQWQCDLGSRRQVGGFAQRFDLDFPDQGIRNAARQSLGVSYAQLVPMINDGIFLSTVHTGREVSKAGLSNLSFDFTGLRLQLIADIGGRWRGLLGLQWEERRFDGAEPLFGVTRSDTQTELKLGLESELDAHWTLQPQIVLTRNRSTLSPSDYRRAQAQLVARYRFE